MATEFSEQVMVRLPPSMLDALRADGEANERNVSQTIRLAIRQFLTRQTTTTSEVGE